MKRIIIALFFLAGTLGFSNVNAQQKTTTKKSKAKTEVTTTSDGNHLKKDGTKDLRYKENKTTKTTTTATTGPKKKDGTADMRYKANKKK